MVASGYARTYQRHAVVTASPGQLVLMLYDGALRFLHRAQEGFARPVSDRKRIEAIHVNIMRAQAILHELNRTLDKEAGRRIRADDGAALRLPPPTVGSRPET